VGRLALTGHPGPPDLILIALDVSQWRLNGHRLDGRSHNTHYRGPPQGGAMAVPGYCFRARTDLPGLGMTIGECLYVRPTELAAPLVVSRPIDISPR